jgi:hypothetical protein
MRRLKKTKPSYRNPAAPYSYGVSFDAHRAAMQRANNFNETASQSSLTARAAIIHAAPASALAGYVFETGPTAHGKTTGMESRGFRRR